MRTAPLEKQQQNRSDGRVLIIDDERPFSDALTRELHRVGLATARADDGAAATALLRDLEEPRAIVLEPNLPGISWYQLLHLAARSTAGDRILVVTAFWSAALADEARLLGVKYCLPKPVTAACVRGAISSTEADRSVLPDLQGAPWPAQPTSLALVEWEHLNQTIRRCSGNMSEAARQLGIHRPTLYKKLRKVPPRSACR